MEFVDESPSCEGQSSAAGLVAVNDLVNKQQSLTGYRLTLLS